MNVLLYLLLYSTINRGTIRTSHFNLDFEQSRKSIKSLEVPNWYFVFFNTPITRKEISLIQNNGIDIESSQRISSKLYQIFLETEDQISYLTESMKAKLIIIDSQYKYIKQDIKFKDEAIFLASVHQTIKFSENPKFKTIKLNDKLYYIIGNDIKYIKKYLDQNPRVLSYSEFELPQTLNRFAAPFTRSGKQEVIYNEKEEILYKSKLSHLTGEGCVGSLLDTGLDYKNCLFYDPNYPDIQFNTIMTNHRKIVRYDTRNGDDKDRAGHGSHTSGSMLGKAYIEDSDMYHYNGVAPDAKINFIDGGTSDSSSTVLFNTPKSYHSLMKSVNSIVMSQSLGNRYGDLITYSYNNELRDHPEFIYVCASGNDKKLKTVNVPGSSANVLTVGALDELNNLNDIKKWDWYLSANGQKTKITSLSTSGLRPSNFSNYLSSEVLVTSQTSCFADENYKAILFKKNGPFSCYKQCSFKINSNDVPSEFKIIRDNSSFVNTKLQVASFSSRGPTSKGLFKPDVIAPGTSIYSGATNSNTGCYGAQLALNQGTSMATPNVAGSALLIEQFFKDGYHINGKKDKSRSYTPPGLLIKSMLIASAVPLDANNKTPHLEYGFGYVNLNRILDVPNVGLRYTEVKHFETFQEYETKIITQKDDKPLIIVMTYLDVGVPAESEHALYTDFDMYVIDPNGHLIFPNGRNTKEYLTNVERVIIDKPIIGEYKIFVRTTMDQEDPEYSTSSFVVFVSGPFVQDDFVTNKMPLELTESHGYQLDCSQHGVNKEGRCQCNYGYTGINCEIEIKQISSNKQTIEVPFMSVQLIQAYCGENKECNFIAEFQQNGNEDILLWFYDSPQKDLSAINQNAQFIGNLDSPIKYQAKGNNYVAFYVQSRAYNNSYISFSANYNAPPTQQPQTITKEPQTPTQKPPTITKEPQTPTQKPPTITKEPQTPTQNPKTPTQNPKTPTQNPKTSTKEPQTSNQEPQISESEPSIPISFSPNPDDSQNQTKDKDKKKKLLLILIPIASVLLIAVIVVVVFIVIRMKKRQVGGKEKSITDESILDALAYF